MPVSESEKCAARVEPEGLGIENKVVLCTVEVALLDPIKLDSCGVIVSGFVRSFGGPMPKRMGRNSASIVTGDTTLARGIVGWRGESVPQGSSLRSGRRCRRESSSLESSAAYRGRVIILRSIQARWQCRGSRIIDCGFEG